MINVRNFIRNSLAFLFVIFTIFAFEGCDIGLGEAVDATAPKLVITYPDPNPVIREDFILAGYCSDDMAVKQITVKLSNTDNDSVEYDALTINFSKTADFYEYTLLENNSDEYKKASDLLKQDPKDKVYRWKIKLNQYNETAERYSYVDGKYNISVKVEDNSKRDSGERTLSVIIDNTKPILVLTRPSKEDSYGTKFDITGQAMDDNNMDLMEIQVFDESGNKLGDPICITPSVPRSIDITAAEFGKDEIYSAIYGSVAEGQNFEDKNFYCQIRICDEARIYRTPDAGVSPRSGNSVSIEDGNWTDVYYLNNDIYSKLLSKYKLPDLYHMKAGSYTGTATAAEQKAAMKILDTPVGDDGSIQTSKTTFTLNPENSPKYSISGKTVVKSYAEFEGSESIHNVLDGATVTIQVSAGRDKVPVYADSIGIKVYKVQPSSNPDFMWEKVEGTDMVILPSYTAGKDNEIIKDENGNPVLTVKEANERAAKVKAVGSYDYTITVKLSSEDGLPEREPYIFEITGYDENGNEVICSEGSYGFVLTTTAVPPSLDDFEPTDSLFYKKHDGFIEISGKASHPAGIPDVKYTVGKVKDGLIVRDDMVADSITDSSFEFKKRIEIKDLVEDENTSEKLLFTIWAEKDDLQSGKYTKVIVYDVDAPVVSLSSTTGTESFIGTTLTEEKIFTGSASDNASANFSGVEVVQYQIEDGEWEDCTGTGKWNITLPFPADSEEGDVIVNFRAIDNAGNISEVISHKVTVDTAVPVFVISSVENDVEDVTAEDGTYYLKASTVKLSGTLTETYLDSCTVDGKPFVTETGDFTGKEISELPEGSSSHKFVVKDKAGQKTELTINIFVDVTEPKAEITSITPYLSFEGKENVVNGLVTIKGSASDNDKVAKTVLKLYEEDAETAAYSFDVTGEIPAPFAKNGSASANGFTITFNTQADVIKEKTEYKLVVESTDRSGNTSTTERTIFVDQDSDKPAISLSNVDIEVDESEGHKVTEGMNLFDQSTNNKILGIISDDDSLTSVILEYSTDKETWKTFYERKNINSSTFNLTAPLVTEKGKTESLPEGSYFIRVTATDNGNPGVYTVSPVFAVGVDNAAPELIISSEQDIFVNPADFTVSGTISDGSGVVKLTGGKHVVVDGSAWTDKITAEDNVTASGSFTYTAEDKYGRRTNATYTFKVDDADPVVNVTSPASDVFLGTTITRIQSFSGTASDSLGTGNSGVLKVQYKVGEGEWTNCTGTGNWTANIEFENVAGDKTVSFRSIDNSGRVSETVNKTVTVDTAVPEFTIESVKIGDNAVSAEDGVYYLSSDTITVSGKITEKNLDSLKSGSDLITSDSGINVDFAKTFEGLSSGNSTLTFIATDKAGQKKTQSINIFVDTTAPTPEFTSVEKLLNYNSKDNVVNGEITIKGAANDNDKLVNTVLSIYQGTETTPVQSWTYTDKAANFSQTFDTTSLKTGATPYAGNVVLRLVSSDRAGNENAAVEKVIYVDQNSDKPTIEFSNIDVSIDETAGHKVSEGNNLFDQTTNNKILGSVSDDDQIKSVVLKYSTDKAIWTEFFKKESINSASYSLNAPFVKSLTDNTPLDEDYYFISVEVTDSGNISSDPVIFAVALDNGSPDISITSEQSPWIKEDSFVVTGTVSDGNPGFEVTGEGNIVLDGNNWTATVTGKNESGSIQFTAKDVFNRTSKATFNFRFDDSAPALAISSPAESLSYLGKTLSTEKSFAGTAGDTAGADNSGIAKVQYSADGGATWVDCAGTANWNTNISFASDDAGEKTISFRAIDNAGNISDLKTHKVIVDTEIPEFNITSVKCGDTVLAPVDGVYYLKGNTVKVSGSLAEVNLESCVVNGNVFVTAAGDFTDNEITLPNGSSTLTFTATDRAGQKKTVSLNVMVDVEAPKPTLSSVENLLSFGGKANVVNGTITVRGAVSDNDKVVATVLELYKGDSDTPVYSTDVTEADLTAPFGNGFDAAGHVLNRSETTFGISIDTKVLDEDSLYKIKISSTDRSDNQGVVIQEIFVDQDSDIPVITLNNVDSSIKTPADVKNAYLDSLTNSNTTTNIFGVKTNNKISLNFSDDDGINSVTAYVYDFVNGVKDEASVRPYNLVSDGSATSYSKELALPQTQKQYWIELSVKDVKSTSTTDSGNNADSFLVVVDEGAPSLDISTTGKIYKKNNEAAVINGTVRDATAITLVRKYKVADGTETAEVEIVPAADSTWSDTITASGNNGDTVTVTYTATDIYGQSQTAEYIYKIDAAGPEFIDNTGDKYTGETNFTVNGHRYNASGWSTDSNITVAGKWKDTGYGTYDSVSGMNNGSGVKTVYYWLQNHGESVPDTSVVNEQNKVSVKNVTGDIVSFEAKIFGFNDNTNTLYFVAVDEAGNRSDVISKSINIDFTSPVLQINDSGDGTFTNKDADKVISGKVTDNLAVSTWYAVRIFAESVPEYTNSATKNETTGLYEMNVPDNQVACLACMNPDDAWGYTTGNFSITVPHDKYPKDESGEVKSQFNLFVVVEDYAGNKTKGQIEVNIDNDKPTVAINGLDNRKGINAFTQAQMSTTFFGTSDDGSGSGIEKVFYRVYKDGTSPVPAFIELASTGTWSDVSSLVFGEGSYTVEAKAVDKAGNYSDTVVKQFDIDDAAPEFTIYAVSEGEESNSSTLLAANTTMAKQKPFELKFSVAETAGLSGTPGVVSIKKRDVAVSESSTDGYTFVWDASTNTGRVIFNFTNQAYYDGIYEIELSATDIIGKTGKAERSVLVDLEGPELSYTQPDFDEWQSRKDVKVSGTADDTSKPHGIYYTFDTTKTAPTSAELKAAGAASTWDAVWTSAGWTRAGASNWEFTVPEAKRKEGEIPFLISGCDTSSNVTPAVLKTIKVDLKDPVIAKVSIKVGTDPAKELSTGAEVFIAPSFVLSGEVTESYKLDTVKLTLTNTFTVPNKVVEKTISSSSLTEDPAGTWSWSYDFKDNEKLTNGNWTFKVEATDAASKSKNAEYSVIVDTGLPVITNAKYYKKGSAVEFSESSYESSNALTIQAAATDEVSGVSYFEYALSDTDVTPSDSLSWTQIINGASGSYSFNLTEGNQYIYLRAVDKAENKGYASSSGRLLKIDGTAPTLEVTSPAAGDSVGTAAVTVTGTTQDAVKFPAADAVVVYQGLISDSNKLASIGASVINSSTGAFSITIPADKVTAFSQGNTNLVVVSKDEAGNLSKATVPVFKDTVPPTIEIKAPLNKTGTDALTTTEQTFSGIANDAGSSIAAVYYAVVNSTASAPAIPATGTTGWNAVTSGTDNWSITYTPAAQGSYVLYVFAEDSYSNRMTSPVSVAFDVDDALPTVTTTLDGNALSVTSVQNKTSTYTFKVTVADTYKLAASPYEVKVTKNGVAVADSDVSVTLDSTAINTDKSKTYKVSISGQTDGLYEYSITATDAYGKKSSVEKRSIRLDRVGPVLTVTSPDFTQWQNSKSVKIIGTASDDSAVNAVYYKKATATAPASGASALNDSTWSTWTKIQGMTTAWNFTSDYSEGDTNKVTVVAVDEHGNVGEAKTFTLKIDEKDPVISNTTYQYASGTAQVLSTGSRTNIGKEVTLKGTVSDTYKLAKVSVTAVKEGDAKTVTCSDITATGTSYDWTQVLSLGSESGKLDDGNWTITVTVEDGATGAGGTGAGRKSSQTYDILVDTVDPVISNLSYKWTKDNTAVSSDSWNNKTGVTVSAKVTDAGTGVSKVEYYVGTSDILSDAIKDDSNSWTAMSGTSGVYTRAFTLAEGTNYIFIRATDKSDRTAYATAAKKVQIDTTVPALTITSGLKVGGVTVNEEDGVYYVKSGTVKVSGTVSDTNFKKLTYGSSNTVIDVSSVFTDKEITVTSGKVTFTAEDQAGNITTASINVVVDTANPVPEFTSVDKQLSYNSKDNVVNGIITIKGAASDNDKLVKTVLSLYKGTNTTAVKTWTYTDNAANFSQTFDTTTLSSYKGNVTLKLVSTDRAGNTNTAVAKTIYVDQDSDLPEISFSNIDTSVTTAAGINKDTNLFDQTANNKILGTITDDDKLSSVRVEYNTSNASTGWTAFFEKNSVNSATYPLSAVLVTSTSDSSALAEGTYFVRVVATDENGKSTTTTPVAIAVDVSIPTIFASKVGTKGYSEGMYVGTNFDLVLSSTSSAKIVKVNELNAGVLGTQLTAGANGTYTISYTGEPATAGTATASRSYRMTDKFGRTSDTLIKYKVDTNGPTITPAKITVKGGSSAALSVSTAATTWLSSESVTITGAAGAVTDSNLASTVSVTTTTGGVSTNSSFELSNISDGTFSTTIAVPNGSSTIKLVFEDEAGNQTAQSISVKTDNVAPTSAALSISPSGVTNANKVTATFTPTDSTSGIAKALIGKASGFADGDAVAAITTGFTSGTAKSVEIDISNETNFPEGTYEFWLRLVDNAGNKMSDVSLGSFTKDKTAPAVTFDTVIDADSVTAGVQVNKTISISGTVSDSNLDADAVPQLFIDSSTTAAAGVTATRDSASKWTISGIDTTTLTDNADHTFKVVFTDKAGNATSADNTLTLNVLQDSDRPEVTIANLATDGTSTIRVVKLSGSVTDDDGAVATFELKLDLNNKDGSTTAGSWKSVTVTNGNWTYDIPVPAGKTIADGNYTIYFRVKDKAGTTYTTASSGNAATMPKIEGTDGAVVATPVSFSVDTEPPVITGNKVYIEYSQDTGKAEAQRTYAKADAAGELSNNTYLGGTKYPLGRISIKASDAVTAFANAGFKATLKGFASGDIEMVKSGTDTFTASGLDFTAENGYINLQIVVEEPSGLTAEVKRSVILDNKAPGSDRNAVLNEQPSTGNMITGEVEYSGLVQDDEEVNSGVETIEYYIPKDSETDVTSAAIVWKTKDESNDEEKITLSSMQWKINKLDMHVKTGTAGNGDTMQDDYAGYETGSDTGLFNIPIWFRITDKVGNVGYSTTSRILYNPDGDRPTVKITYPVEDTVLAPISNADGSTTDRTLIDGTVNYKIMGGNLMITGTATDNEGVDSVYIQYDVDGDGEFTDTDKTWLTTNASKVFLDGATVETLNINGAEFWGIKVDGKLTWNATFKAGAKDNSGNYLLSSLEIDGKDSSNNPINPDNKTLNFRVRSVDNDTTSARGQLVSAWSQPVHVSVNNSIPSFQDFILNQYDDADKTNKIASQNYKEDKYISGENWFLEGSIRDADGISSIEVTGSATGTMTSKAAWFTDPTAADIAANGNGKLVSIPVSSASGKWEIQVQAYDNDQTGGKKDQKAKYVLNIDNTPPEFSEGTVGGAGSDKDDIKIHIGSQTGFILNSTNKVQNSNGTFTLAGKIDEAGSGFERVALYFVRRGTGTNKDRIYNVMKAYGADRTENRTDLSSTQGTGVYIDTNDKLPLKHVTGLTRSAEDSFTMTAACDDNVRVGGLVKIGGSYKRITDISADKKTISMDSGCDKSFTDAYLVYATLSIDQSNDSKKDGVLVETDGDGLIESYSKQGSTYLWDASFNSLNIPDGPIEVHFVAFDVAGNMKHGMIHSSVSNNPPRLAKVYLGTDLNQNDEFEENEFTEYASTKAEMAQTVVNALDKWELVTSNFTVKKDLAVVPEFVGGTGTIRMVMSKNAANSNAVSGTLINALTGDAADKLKPAAAASKEWNSGYTGLQDITSNFLKFKLTNTELWGSDPTADGSDYAEGVVPYSFTFWDETEEMVQGTTTQNAVLWLKDLYLDVVDSVKPTTIIKPFKWVSKTDNSLYQNSTANGHIELEGDLAGGTWTDYTAGAPKISGKVVFRGTAYDNVGLSKLQFKFGNEGNTFYATYNKTTKAWAVSINVDGIGTFNKANGGSFTENDANIGRPDMWHIDVHNTIDARDLNFTTDETYYNQTGHQVAWEFAVDTETLVENLTQIGGKLQVIAVDLSGNETSVAAADVGLDKNNVPEYVVDVVPYITKVTTGLSGKSKKLSSVYDRSALGHYPVRSDETFTLSGFNLATTSVAASTLSSGYYVATTNGVKSINNLNNNNAVGQSGKTYTDDEYAYCYNRQPNGMTNEEFTDDIYFDVWEFKKAAVTSSGKLNEPVMRINPTNDMITFGFANGTDRLSLPTKTASYKLWQRNYADYAGINYVFDNSGNVHSVSIGLDTEPNSGYAGRMQFIYSPWDGSGTNLYNWNREKTVALESIGIPSGVYVNGTKLTANFLDLERFGRPSIAVTTTRTTPTVYLAYYDSDNDQIRFRYGTINLDNRYNSSKYNIFDLIADDKYVGNMDSDNSAGATNYARHKMFETTKDRYALIAGTYWSQTTADTVSSATGNGTSEFVALDVITDATTNTVANDKVVIVWYDGSNLMYTYRYGTKDNTDCKSDGVANKWSKPVTIFTGAGEYCAIKADAQGGIHIAAYDKTNADLYYAYMPSYDGYDNLKTAVVDSYQQIGKHISLDVALVERVDASGNVVKVNDVVQYNAIPYITYFGESYNGLPKIAYLPGGINQSAPVVPDGSNLLTDEFTGKWECEVIPTISSVNEDNMNIGLWKTAAGVLKASTKPASGYTEPKITAAGTNTANWYGNGTSKVVLGYGITSGITGFIETAQMK